MTTTTTHRFADVETTPAKIARVAECSNMPEILDAMQTARECANGYIESIAFASDRSWFNVFSSPSCRPPHVINKTPDDRPIVMPSIWMENGMFVVRVWRKH